MDNFEVLKSQQLVNEMQTCLDVFSAKLHEEEEQEQRLAGSAQLSLTLSEVKRQIIRTCGKMQIQLEDPLWALMNLGSSYTITTAMSVMLDLEIQNNIPEQGHVRLADLAFSLKVDPQFLKRVLNILTGTHILEETQPDCFCHTRISLLLRDKNIRDLLVNNVTLGFRGSAFALETWKECQYRNLDTPEAVPFRRAFKASYYDYLFKLKPQLGSEFFQAMEALTNIAARDISLRFPFEEALTHAPRPKGRAVMVDVGGGRGQVVHRIWKQMPKDLAHFIVQDLNFDEQMEGLEYQRHGFFLPQPVTGAHIYFLRHILHNYGDSDCVSILNNIAQAMVRGQSKLVICERVVPPNDPPLALTQFDLVMGILFGGMERSKEQFTGILEKVQPPLVLRNVITDDPIRESFLEIELL